MVEEECRKVVYLVPMTINGRHGREAKRL